MKEGRGAYTAKRSNPEYCYTPLRSRNAAMAAPESTMAGERFAPLARFACSQLLPLSSLSLWCRLWCSTSKLAPLLLPSKR
jgi:hypothetical protein